MVTFLSHDEIKLLCSVFIST